MEKKTKTSQSHSRITVNKMSIDGNENKQLFTNNFLSMYNGLSHITMSSSNSLKLLTCNLYLYRLVQQKILFLIK